MPPGGRVLEFINDNFKNECFKQMASKLGIEHRYHKCSPQKREDIFIVMKVKIFMLILKN